MAESMSSSHIPDEKFLNAYERWADGAWGMILTGQRVDSLEYFNANDFPGNVQVSDVYLGAPNDVAISSKVSDQSSKAVQDAWKSWATTCQRQGTPTIVQLCHPGRQSPAGAGNRTIFTKTIAPSAVQMVFGPSLLERLAVSWVFGTPRELAVEEISGPGGIVDQFVAAAEQSFQAGFKGVELHGA